MKAGEADPSFKFGAGGPQHPAAGGLGYLIMQAGDYLNTALVFSGIIAIAILGLTLDACLRGLLLLADPSRRR